MFQASIACFSAGNEVREFKCDETHTIITSSLYEKEEEHNTGVAIAIDRGVKVYKKGKKVDGILKADEPNKLVFEWHGDYSIDWE